MNPFAAVFAAIPKFFKKTPLISTSFAAVLLSSSWTLAWLTTFFLSTWLFDLTTTSHDFVYLFWLSIAAEAVIRWAENTNLIARLSKPHMDNPVGDNADFTFVKAGFLCCAGCLLMFFVDRYFEGMGLKDEPRLFTGLQGTNGVSQFEAMLTNWITVGAMSNVWLPILVGTFFRAMIYKRSHTMARSKPQEQKKGANGTN